MVISIAREPRNSTFSTAVTVSLFGYSNIMRKTKIIAIDMAFLDTVVYDFFQNFGISHDYSA